MYVCLLLFGLLCVRDQNLQPPRSKTSCVVSGKERRAAKLVPRPEVNLARKSSDSSKKKPLEFLAGGKRTETESEIIARQREEERLARQ